MRRAISRKINDITNHNISDVVDAIDVSYRERKDMLFERHMDPKRSTCALLVSHLLRLENTVASRDDAGLLGNVREVWLDVLGEELLARVDSRVVLLAASLVGVVHVPEVVAHVVRAVALEPVESFARQWVLLVCVSAGNQALDADIGVAQVAQLVLEHLEAALELHVELLIVDGSGAGNGHASEQSGDDELVHGVYCLL